jgi:alkanesulfonate monooxygenase SsuD/methylene tetrahydromethanopterin reductase-like flavin-dependent oxidoreductase (luciferase family)
MPAGKRVRFGLIYIHLENDRQITNLAHRQTYETQWREVLEHIAWAEQVGFESVWLTERHFSAYPPSPLILAAAIAARTTTMRIGTNLLVAPLHNPVRLAEEAAMVSVLSNGRFDLGVGQGHREIDFTNFGVNIRHRPSLLEETVAILRLAWSGEPFTFSGRRYTIPIETGVRPVPHCPPRILIGATSPPGMARAARLGDGFMSAFNGNIRQYLAAAQEADSGTDIPIFAAQQAIVAEDPEREWATVGPFALGHVNQNLPADRRLAHPDEALAQKLIGLWDGPTAVERILTLLDRYPTIEDVHFIATSGPGEALDHTRPRLQYLAEKVLPRVRERLQSS